MTDIRRQELYCHECNRYVQFDMDLSLNGNHVLNCPNCGHEHCRVVENGEITGIRWEQRNGPTWTISLNSTASSISTFASSTTNDSFTYSAWMNLASST